MKTQHQKHTKLSQPELGVFARQEWAFMGAPCGVIQSLARHIVETLGQDHAVAYVDADHAAAGGPEHQDHQAAMPQARLLYTDKIAFQRMDMRLKADTFTYRRWFQDQDLVLVNGNHFQARRQLVLLDPRKYDSLQRKLDRLTAVEGFIQVAPGQEIPSFLQDHLPNWATLPVWPLDEPSEVAAFIRNEITKSVPQINGLVLAGGQSRRMGQDKGQLSYHGLPQREYLYQLMEEMSLPAYLSCRPDQTGDIPPAYRLLPDSFLGLGPFGAILSAFRQDPNRAWLVVACDLPFIDRAGLEHLIAKRDPSCLATAFHNPATGFPDPLLTLWEPRAYATLLQFLAQGYSCPRKVLINSTIKCIAAPDRRLLINVNNPAELEEARSLLANRAPNT